MKRRAISFITALALCLGLCPMGALAAVRVDKEVTLPGNTTAKVTYDIEKSTLFDTKGYTYTVSEQTAVSVKSTGKLYLTYGKFESQNGAGIEVLTGGLLRVDQPGMTVAGTTYGLDIASGTDVELSGGTFTGGIAAIQAEDYRALLVAGYAYFYENNTPITLFNADGSQITEEVAGAKTVMVKPCEGHVYAYKANDGEPTHNGTCIYCGAVIGPLPCTFVFDETNHAACEDKCGHTLDITISPVEEEYDGTGKPSDNVSVTVTLDGSTTLAVNSDYTVDFPTRVDVGETLITVTGVTYNGTYETRFGVTRAQPVITWAEFSKTVDYDGSPVDKNDLPEVTITAKTGPDSAELEQLLYFSYKKDGETNFTVGLPTNAGTYKIKAILPETTNYKRAESAEITLIINPIDPIITHPEKRELTYNRSAQELVTPGTLDPRAVGAKILFALGETVTDSDYSETIPTGTNAGTYFVWYKVEGTNNYNEVRPEKIAVTIQRKPITPEVKLSYYTCIYDGGFKQPAVTVIDPQDRFVLPDSEYEVTYGNNQKAGTATVTITDKAYGNYDITTVTVNFEITPADQDALTITNVPDAVIYGDVFTLVAVGGSGSGTITWEITTGKDSVATVDPASGQITVVGVGTATVKATKAGTDYKEMTATWTFTAGKRSVVATVTADDKTYDGNNTATVHAEVPAQDIVSGDTITITVTGTFSSADAGAGKTVTVIVTGGTVNGTPIANANGVAELEKYIITIPTTTTADIHKAAVTVTAPTSKAPIYSGEPQELVNAAAVAPSVTTSLTPTFTVEYSLYADGPWSTSIPTGTDAGRYEVWYRVKESDNYLGTAPEKVVVTIAPQSVTVSNSNVTLTPDPAANGAYYVYDGSEKKPAVTVSYAENGKTIEIPASEYTVTYSNNVNAGTATVIITDNVGGNYAVSGTVTFTITGGQAVLTGTPQAKNLTYNGNPQDLVTAGTASGGSLEYAWKEGNLEPADGDYSSSIPKGTVAGLYKVYYRVKGDGNHGGIDAPSVVYVTIQPKTVSSPVIELPENKTFTYNGSEQTFSDNEITVKDGTVAIPSSEYTVAYSDNVDAGTATVRIIDNNGGNYTVNGSKTFTINKATAKFADGKSPAAANLTYTGSALPLVTPGEPVGGTAVYSLNGGAYSAEIPTGIASGTYTVRAKVLGDKNHEDCGVVGPITVTIGQKTVPDPDIELSSATFRYNGSEQKPTITVKDEKGNVIPANEYTVTYTGNTVNIGEYTITIANRAAGNYDLTFTDTTKSNFKITIVAADQETLTITGKPSVVHYGDTIQLSTTGGSGNGTVVWSIVAGKTEGYIKEGDSEGQFIITGVGKITIKAVRTPANGNYAPVEDTWTFHAYPKPITAVVTAANKVYDGNTAADLTITVPGTDFKVTGGVTGTFGTADVGTDKTVTITVDSAGATVTGTNSDKNNYDITFPATTTASITPATPTVSGVTKKTGPGSANLEYTGGPQALVTSGSATGVSGEPVGDVVYSLDGNSYGLSVPTGTNAGTYTVWYKVMASGNYRDSAPVLLTVTIDPKTVDASALTVTCSPSVFPYDGTEKTPNVIVKDSSGNVIPASEYTVEYPSDRTAVKNGYEVIITDKQGGNYQLTGTIKGTFNIVPADQAPLSIVVSGSLNVFYGDTFRLSTVGGSGTGAVKWKIESDVAEISEEGVVTVKGTGSFTVTAQKEGTGSYGVSNEDSVTFTAKPKQITPVITVDDKPYDGNQNATLHMEWKNGDVLEGDTITAKSSTGGAPTGTFSSADAGTNKQVTVDVTFTGHEGKYEIVLPALITGSIYKVDAKLDPTKVPQAKTGLKYSGSSQTLLDTGATVDNIGTVEYSLSEKGSYSTEPPAVTNAGTYTVWYRVAESVNWTGIGPVSVEVTIGKAKPDITPPKASPIYDKQPLSKSELTGGSASFSEANVPGTFAWKDSTLQYEQGKSYEVIFTPDDQNNFESVTITIQIGADAAGSPDSGGTSTPPTAEPNTESPSLETTVRDGTASTVVNEAAGKELVDKAVAEQSGNAVIKPEITGSVTRTEVSIPSSAMSRLGRETDASLTVSTPVADVTIPNKALETLADAGDTVSVVTERVENTVVLTLTADGKELTDIPGGLKLTVPVGDAGPGTVAVLVHEDGTREIIRRSVAGEYGLRIPLNGSATVEIVADNSRKFADIPADSSAADAVAFVSARELFKGTGNKTFNPEATMTRAMLVTVLYNLAGCPEQNLTDKFSDVGSDAWYAAAVSWAAANGITNGYGSGLFGPNDAVTREQLAVMLWRYMGIIASDKQVLDFPDAGRASGYALEALVWTTENNILSDDGESGQLDPGSTATRAQAAQILKCFIENT